MKKSLKKSLVGLLASVMLSSMSAGTDAAVIEVTEGTGTSHTGANDLVKNGSGIYTLSGQGNTYTGTTTVNAGTLRVDSEQGLYHTSKITVNSGAVLELAGKNALYYAAYCPDMVLNGGSIISTVSGDHVNVGNIVWNGGVISSEMNPSANYGNILFNGEVHVTQDALIDAQRILIRTNSSGIPGKAGNFIIDAGKTLTIDSEINFHDRSGSIPMATWNISGGGTVKMLQATTKSTLNDVKINISGEGTTLDLAASNALQVDKESYSTITLTDGGRLNISTPGIHSNLGYVVFNGGSLEAVDASGNLVTPTDFGNYIANGKWTVQKDSSINAEVWFRGAEGTTSGQVEVLPGATLTWGGIVDFAGGWQSPASIQISGGGTVLVPTNATMQGVSRYVNGIELSGDGTKLIYGDGGNSGSWNAALTLNEGTLFETNRSALGHYAFNVYGQGGTISNVGTAETTFSWLIYSNFPEEAEAANLTEPYYGLTFTGTKAINVIADKLEGEADIRVTGQSARLNLLGNSPNFSGDTVLQDGGTLSVSTSNPIGTGKLIFDGGILQNSGSGDLPFNNDVEVRTTGTVNTNSRTFQFNGSLSGDGTLTKIGAQQLQLFGDNSGFSGTIDHQRGWLGINAVQASSENMRVSVNNGTEGSGVFFVTASDDEIVKMGMMDGTNPNANVRAGANAVGKVSAVNLQVGGSDMSGKFAGVFLDYNGVKMNIEKVGTGTWTLTGNHLTTGTLTVSGGKVQIGDGSITENLGDKVRTAGHLRGFTYVDADTIPDAMMPIVLNDGGTLSFNRNDPDQLRINQPITANGGTVLQEGTKPILFQGVIAGEELVIDASETGTGNIFFQRDATQGTTSGIKTDTSNLDKLTVNGGTVIAKVDFNAVDLNGGTFWVGNAYSPTTVTGEISLNEGGVLAPGNGDRSVVENLVFSGGSVKSVNDTAILTVNNAEAAAGTTSYIAMNFNARTHIMDSLTGSGSIVLEGQGAMQRQLKIYGDASQFEGTLVSKDSGFVGFETGSTTSGKMKLQSEGNGNFFFSAGANDSGVFEIGELSSVGNSVGEARPGASNTKAVTMRVGGLNTDSEFAGIIREYNEGHPVSVTKTGTGMWTISGQNSYNGATTVEAGVLNITGTITSNTTVKDGAYLTGIGTIDGNLFMEAGSAFLLDLANEKILQQIASSDILTVTGDVEAEDEFTLKLVADEGLFGNLEAISYDILMADNMETLNIIIDDSEADGEWHLKYDDTSNILSLVGALAGGGGEGGGGAGGSDVPEPSTFVLLFSALGFFGLTYAKRRRQK